MAQRRYYELLTYRLITSSRTPALLEFLADAAIPAWNRQGIEPVGVLTTVYGTDMAAVHVLLPHPTIESVGMSRDKLLADTKFLEAGAEIIESGESNPAFVRMESSLLIGFPSMPSLELPDNNLERKSRIFEMRTYESPSLKTHKKKIEMFDRAGEIELFREIGLRPVMFAETIIGPRLPNLVYMLTFDSMVEHDEAWDRFKVDPRWIALRDDPQFSGLVSCISDIVFSPTSASQI